MNKIDVICPIFYVDLDSFKLFLDTWQQNIPIKYLMIGLGAKNDELEKVLARYDNVITFYQQKHKTLGYCLQELMGAVTTDYFVYLHADVEILLNWYEMMWESKVRGILESLKDPSFGPEALVQARRYRAYSGAQLILKKSIKDLNWEDDYIYCNEDLILKSVVLNRGYTYVKTSIYHKHYRMFSKRTQPRDTILKWQYKGILKYAYPTFRLMNYVKGIKETLIKTYDQTIDLERDIKTLNPEWLPFFKS